jgi:acyl carrier protein
VSQLLPDSPPVTADRADRLVRRVIAARAPLRWRGLPLPDELPLGGDGLGLDSVSMVELLLECEEALGFSVPDAIFDEGPLSVGRLVTWVRRLAAERQAT